MASELICCENHWAKAPTTVKLDVKIGENVVEGWARPPTFQDKRISAVGTSTENRFQNPMKIFTISSSFLRRLAVLLAVWLGTAAVVAQTNETNGTSRPVDAQEPVQEAAQESEGDDDETGLPKHAIWRHGEFGELTKLNGFYRVKFSPDGKLLATRNQQNTLFLIDVETQETLFEFKGYEDRQWIQNIDFSPDSKLMLTATKGANETISIWNTSTGELHRALETDGKAAFFQSPTEVTVLQNETVSVYSANTGKKISSYKWGDRGSLPLTCSRDGLTVVFAKVKGRDPNRTYSIYIYDVLKKTAALGLLNSKASPRRMAISEDGNWLAGTFRRDKLVRIWDLRDPRKSTVLRAHAETAESVCFSQDSRFLTTTGWDSQVHVWDVLTGKRIGNLEGHVGHVVACGFAPNGFRLATGANSRQDCSVLVWDFRSLVFSELDGTEKYDFETLWATLGGNDFRASFDAISILINNSGKFESQVSKKLGLISAVNSGELIAKWIIQLSSRRFAERVAAEDRLKKSRARAEPVLRELLKQDGLLLEVRYRIQRILRQPIERPKIETADLRRLHRIIYALELSGTEQSQDLLQNLAESHDHIDVSRDASESLKRVKTNRD